MGSRILIVDHDREIADIIELHLQKEKYDVTRCCDGNSALELIEQGTFDLVLLEAVLPDADGFSVLKKIRMGDTFPIIILTEKADYKDKIKGLRLGADDYITKPFHVLEMIARVQAQLRRFTQYNKNNWKQEDMIDTADLLIRRSTHECICFGQKLKLTPTEFDILWILCENLGQVISPKKLFEQVWKEKYYKNSNNTVMVHIRHLRKKINQVTEKTDFIKTIWGVGYQIEQ